MKQCHLPPDQRPSGHIPELYIDAEALVDAGVVTLEEMDLITLGFGIVVMRTCGVDCPVYIDLGSAWPSQIGNHG